MCFLNFLDTLPPPHHHGDVRMSLRSVISLVKRAEIKYMSFIFCNKYARQICKHVHFLKGIQERTQYDHSVTGLTFLP